MSHLILYAHKVSQTTTLTNLNCLVFYDGQPVEQGAEFDNVEEDGHLRSRLIFEVGQLRETFLPLSLTRV